MKTIDILNKALKENRWLKRPFSNSDYIYFKLNEVEQEEDNRIRVEYSIAINTSELEEYPILKYLEDYYIEGDEFTFVDEEEIKQIVLKLIE